MPALELHAAGQGDRRLYRYRNRAGSNAMDSRATIWPLELGSARQAMPKGGRCSARIVLPTSAEKDDGSGFAVPCESVMYDPLFVPSRDPQGILHFNSHYETARFPTAKLDVPAKAAALTESAVEHARLYET